MFNDLVENIESLADGSGLDDDAITVNKLNIGSVGATIATSESSSSTSFTDLATPGPSVTTTIGSSGLALLILTADFYSSTDTSYVFMGFVASGANTIAPLDTSVLFKRQAQNIDQMAGSWCKMLTGLNAGSTTFKAQYHVSAGTGVWANRSIVVIPL